MARRRTSHHDLPSQCGSQSPASARTPRRKSWAKDIEREILLPSKPPSRPGPASRCGSSADNAQAGGGEASSPLPPLLDVVRANTSPAPDGRHRKRLAPPAAVAAGFSPRPGSSCSAGSGASGNRSPSVASVRSVLSSATARAERSLSPDYVIPTKELAAELRQSALGRGDARRISLPAAIGASSAASSSSSSASAMPSSRSRRRADQDKLDQSLKADFPSLPEGAVALAEADAKFKHASIQMLLYNGRRDKEGKALEETVNELVPGESSSMAKQKFKDAYRRASQIRALVEGKDDTDAAEAELAESDLQAKLSESGKKFGDEDEYWKQMWALTKTMMRSKDSKDTDPVAEKQKQRVHSQELAALGIVPASPSLIPGSMRM